MSLTRRNLLGAGVASAAAIALGPGFWRQALAASPARPGPGPYGPLGPPDANGLRLPAGFRSRVLARAGVPVEGTGYVWPPFPDGKAAYATPDGGWILAVNSEVPGGAGGASAVKFDREGSVTDAYRILSGTSTNCSGGPTPWGTWLSCEEVDEGRVWECDPTGARPSIAHPAMGVFKHEAAAVDPEGRRVYLTEDLSDGCFYRFTSHRWPDLSAGLLEVAVVAPDGVVTWQRIPDPLATAAPTRQQVRDATRFRRGEGIWFDSGVVYVATTSDSRVHAYNVVTETHEVLYDGEALGGDAPLRDVDNITAGPSGDLYVCEDDGGDDPLDICVITPDREVARVVKLTGGAHDGSELTGVSFDPSGKRMYFTSQRGFGLGITYEVAGPFRTERRTPSAPAPLRVEVMRASFGGATVAVWSAAPQRAVMALRANVTRPGRRRGPVTLARSVTELDRGRTEWTLRVPRAKRRLLRGRRGLTARLELHAGAQVERRELRLKR